MKQQPLFRHILVAGILLLTTGFLVSCGQEQGSTPPASDNQPDVASTSEKTTSNPPDESQPSSPNGLKLEVHDTQVPRVVERFDLDLDNPGEPSGEVALEGRKLKFNRNLIVARKGKPITVTFRNNGFVSHAFEVPSMNVKTETIQPDNTTFVTLTPEQSGYYWFYCNVAEHKRAGMEGVMVVR